jgi:pyruvate carboxylase subunit B
MATKRRIHLNDRPVELEIDETASGASVRLADGSQVAARLEPIGMAGEGLFLLLLNNRTHVIALTPAEGGHEVTVRGRIQTAVTDSRRIRAIGQSGTGAGDAGSGPVTIRSSITGMIVDVLVHTGDAVRQGETLLIVEAMKMQNEVKAPRAGQVAKINVGKGDRVERGATMLVLDPPHAEATP